MVFWIKSSLLKYVAQAQIATLPYSIIGLMKVLYAIYKVLQSKSYEEIPKYTILSITAAQVNYTSLMEMLSITDGWSPRSCYMHIVATWQGHSNQSGHSGFGWTLFQPYIINNCWCNMGTTTVLLVSCTVSLVTFPETSLHESLRQFQLITVSSKL